MGKKRRILFAVLALAVLGGMAWMILRPVEPVYQGKPLSAWLENLDFGGANQSAQRSEAAKTAIQNMGTNAIPIMLQLLRTRPDSPWKIRLLALAQKQHIIKINQHVEPIRRYFEAVSGFKALGPRAVGAVPKLMKIYDQNPEAQSCIAMILGSIGPDARAAVPVLLRGALSTNEELRCFSLYALGDIGAEPNLVVPVFINALQDPRPQIQYPAASGLVAFGTNARPAVPALVKLIGSKAPPAMTNNADFNLFQSVKTVALQILEEIDPEAAAKALINLEHDRK